MADIDRPSTTITINAIVLLRKLLLIFIRIPPKDSYEYTMKMERGNAWPTPQTDFASAHELYSKQLRKQISGDLRSLWLQCDTKHDLRPVFIDHECLTSSGVLG